ncbi:hypothetical protein M2G93_19265 [Vibrio vulnificus]|uniref:hypothetical protein n=1 Tax=Vibrio vulnificus TaxID=672 RepID=UPI0021D8C2FC|nr:hypothetical protein [Vibrio vulnificus]EKZ9225732.1 hypothetical protein [Vibrio vulnificus]ELC9582577.1 hypothetical protein [Vibrio vulnificus]MCU8150264.1 hypothetical protein [Vibrio vulnificus]MCU8386940.1 hypothetical protein [Vibrio vulnificus]
MLSDLYTNPSFLNLRVNTLSLISDIAEMEEVADNPFESGTVEASFFDALKEECLA